MALARGLSGRRHSPSRPRAAATDRIKKYSSSGRRSPALPTAPPTQTVQSSDQRCGVPTRTSTSGPAEGYEDATANYDAVSYVVSDRKILKEFTKPNPVMKDGTRSYRKVVTKTVTMTVTTTIATTEILLPGEPGYEESRKRERIEKTSPRTQEVYRNTFGVGGEDSDNHQRFHRAHHYQQEGGQQV